MDVEALRVQLRLLVDAGVVSRERAARVVRERLVVSYDVNVDELAALRAEGLLDREEVRA